MILPPDTQSQPLSSRTSTARVPPRWLAPARGAWIVCALLLLANFVASIPAYYRLMLNVCTLPNQITCTLPSQPENNSGQLTPGNVQALAQLHLSLTTYAIYFVTLTILVSLLFWGIGLLIFWRKSDEVFGLFASLLIVSYGATGVNDYFLGTYAPTHLPLLFQILLYIFTIAQWTCLGAFLLTFPTGRFVPRWSWLFVLPWILSSFWNPTTPIPQAVEGLLLIGGTVCIMIYRYMRVFDTVQRQQTKWFVFAAAIAMLLAGLGSALPGLVPADSPFQLFSTTLSLLSLTLLPLSIGIAILRYRLWDIDVIIKRTLVYGALTICLGLIYAGLVFGLDLLLRGFIDQSNAVVLVVSTLVIAAIFQPLRHRLQAIIDRRFYRRKYDAAKTLEAFSATLRNEVDLDRLHSHLLEVVQETMQPAHVSLWLRPTNQGRKQDTNR
jgi:hypothetical protein